MLARRNRWKSSLLLVLLAGLCLAQSASVPPEVRRVGDKLACLCGVCNNSVATCSMLGCHYSAPARKKIAEMLKEGASDQAIIDSFVKKEGLRALSEPPTQGFSLLSWVMPFAMIALGLGAIAWWVQRSRSQRQTAAIPELPPQAISGKVQEQLNKEMANFED